MSGPDRIWAGPWEARPSRGQWSSAQEIVGEGHEYIRRDPAVIAALPEVQAIVDAAVKAEREACAQIADGFAQEKNAEAAKYRSSSKIHFMFQQIAGHYRIVAAAALRAIAEGK